MARTNYGFEKRQRDLAKRKKKEEKLQRKLEKRAEKKNEALNKEGVEGTTPEGAPASDADPDTQGVPGADDNDADEDDADDDADEEEDK